VIVNTCGFLDSRRRRNRSESAIGDAMAENGKVIVTGCMGAEPEQIRKRLSQSARDHRAAAIRERAGRRASRRCRRSTIRFVDLVPPQGIKLTPRHYAYLKISEGCNNRCTFCIIPKLRGDLSKRARGRRAARGRSARERPASRNSSSSRRTPRLMASI
jgi:ribosomal protein S12 methylthiotransferase